MSSRQIKEYKKLGQRKHRQKERRFVVEGFYLLEEAVNANLTLEVVFYTDHFLQMQGAENLLRVLEASNLIKLDERTFDDISQTETPQGVGGIARIPEQNVDFLNREDCIFLVLDGLQDPGNVGAIIRSAAAAGLHGMLLMPGTVDPFNPKAVRASMGGIFHLPLITEEAYLWMEVAAKKFRLFAADARCGIPYDEVDYKKPCAIIIGNESRGISDTLLGRAMVKVSIPLKGKINSLNAAIAASIFIFEAVRQRKY